MSEIEVDAGDFPECRAAQQTGGSVHPVPRVTGYRDAYGGRRGAADDGTLRAESMVIRGKRRVERGDMHARNSHKGGTAAHAAHDTWGRADDTESQ